MKTLVKQVYNIYYLFITDLIQDCNKRYKSKIVRYVMISWVLGLMFLAYTGIIFMIYMTITQPIGMAI
jgi:hypothetical protein